MNYRPDIDGLRAVAVVPVILFHAGLSVFPGGFVGVDVFFVISGYLITGIIYREIQSGKFSILSFYERRARRIVPALFLVLLASTIAAYWTFLPRPFMKFGETLGATAIFGANIHFYFNQGYFAGDAKMEALLHMWSLGVEEQFYIFLPLILLFLSRKKLSVVRWLSGAALITFAATLVAVYVDPKGAFFLLHYRAWELLLGSLLAVCSISQVQSRAVREGLGAVGLAMILASALLLSEHSLFPGLLALGPCLGAVLLIYVGGSGSTVVGGLLSSRVMVWIGLISYPLYLWHWPIFVFAKQYLSRELSAFEIALALTATIIISVLTWRFVEMPIRKRVVFKSRGAVMMGTLAVGAFAFVTCGVTIAFKGLPARWPEPVSLIANGAFDYNPLRSSCDAPSEGPFNEDTLCFIGDLEAKATFAVLGDSHGGALWPAIDSAAKKHKVKGVVLTHIGCQTMLGVTLVTRGEDDNLCRDFNDKATQYVAKNPDLKTLFLVNRWLPDGLDTKENFFFRDSQSGLNSHEETNKVFARGLDREIAALKGRRIVVTLPIPEYTFDVPSHVALATYYGRDIPQQSLEFVRNSRSDKVKAFQQVAQKYPLEFLDLTSAFCEQAVCRPIRDGRALYFDRDHPTGYAVDMLEPIFRQVFEGGLSLPNEITLVQ